MSMSTTVDIRDETTWLRLHEVRLRGRVDVTEDPATDRLLQGGYLATRGRSLTITPAGRQAHAAWARLADGSDEHSAAWAAYERFLELDKQVKRLTADWQQASATSRPDGYTAEDWTLIDRLLALDEKAGAVLLRLGRAVPRFAGYRPRFRAAVQRLEDGDRQWFSGLTCDSYHAVWWQLHEDLLLAIGVARGDDPNQ
jgi:hypothetical protein